jgi:hypothetical protein
MTLVQPEVLTRNDPWMHDFEMPFRASYYPLGFPLKITTNSIEVLTAAEESWGRFRKIHPDRELHMRIGVMNHGPSASPANPVLREQGGFRAHVADAENFAFADVEHGFAFAWLTRATVEDRAYLRWCFIEGVSWDLLEPYLTPIHVGCVQLNGRGVLLCGDSGAGKSSLSYACARNGWAYLSDDSSCLVHGREGAVVVGDPFKIRFRESAIDVFPELKSQHLAPRFTGEMAIELPTSLIPEIKTISECSVDYIVFLNRGHRGPASLFPFPTQTALQWFEKVVFCGEKNIVDAHKVSLRNLLTAQVFELRYDDLASAIGQLELLVHRGS